MWVGVVTSCIACVSVLALCWGPTFSLRRARRDTETHREHALLEVGQHSRRTEASRDGEKARLLSCDV